MSPALNNKALLYATPTHLPSICPFTRPHVIISALSMHLPPVLWAWIRAPATHFLGARILTTLPLSIPPAAFSALPQHLPSPFSVIILSSQYLFQRGPIWIIYIQGLTLSTVPSSGTSDIGRRTSTSVQLLFRLTSGIIRRIILRVITGPVKSPLLKKIGSDLQEIYESMKTCEPIAQQSSVTS